nr:PREDICTED: proteinase-activated receptor 1-like [Latimeria chalumnae]|eukprot:XP_014354557.1 PREDICTED: proteinase-activated receptor 1-like [Latimeria chalumnae]
MPGSLNGRQRTFVSDTVENKTVVEKSVTDYLASKFNTMVIPSLYCIVLLIGLPANALALLILITKTKITPSTIFLINLTLADLFFILLLPLKISYHFLGSNWLFGEALCRIYIASFYGSITCSVFLLMSISIDKYFAIVYPMFSRSFRNRSKATFGAIVIWILALFSIFPFLLSQQTLYISDVNITSCHDILPREEQNSYYFHYFLFLVILGFIVPFLVIIFCYISIIWTLSMNARSQFRAKMLSTLVTITFLLCFMPSNVVLVIHYSEFHASNHSDLYVSYMVCLVLSAFNTCIDPFVYYYISDEFRDKVRQLLQLNKGKASLSSSTTQEIPICRLNTSASGQSSLSP